MVENGRFLELLAIGVASGRSIRDTVAEIKCSETQGYRIAATPEFKARVSELRSETTSGVIGKLTAAATSAADTLTELLGPENDSRDRLAAAKTILSMLAPLAEFHELRERIARLEAQLQPPEPNAGAA